jgi:hypothetical protein
LALDPEPLPKVLPRGVEGEPIRDPKADVRGAHPEIHDAQDHGDGCRRIDGCDQLLHITALDGRG